MKIDIVLNEFCSPNEVAELGKLAESYGINAIWTENYASARDPFLALAPLAAKTEQIKLRPLALSPFEMHPLKISNALLTLNELSGGRAGVLIGAGGGILMSMCSPNPPRKVRAVHEAIEIVKQGGAQDHVMYDGELYSVFACSTAWHTEENAPMVYAGASGPMMTKMAAKVADGTMLSDFPIEMLEDYMPVLNQALADAGRDKSTFVLNNFLAWHIKEDADAAYKEARSELYIRGLLQPMWLDYYLNEEDSQFVTDNMQAFRMAFRKRTHEIEGVPDRIVDALVEGLSSTGGLDALPKAIEKLKKFEAMGVDEVALRAHNDQEEMIRMIGEEVVPHFEKAY